MSRHNGMNFIKEKYTAHFKEFCFDLALFDQYGNSITHQN